MQMAASHAEQFPEQFQALSLQENICHRIKLLCDRNVHPADMNICLKGIGGLECCEFKEEKDEDQNGMKAYNLSISAHIPFVEIRQTLLNGRKPLKVWIQHTTSGEINEALHKKHFHVRSFLCSFGAFVDPFTFNQHAMYQAKHNGKQSVHFDFEKDLLTVELEESYQIQMSFNQFREALVVQLSDSEYRFFIYFVSVPRLWRKRNNDVCRIVSIPGVQRAVIGQCSVIGLNVCDFRVKNVPLLLAKLATSNIRIWWANVEIKQPLSTPVSDLEMSCAPWPIRWLFSAGYRLTDQLTMEDYRFLNKHSDLLYELFHDVLLREVIVNVMKECSCKMSTAKAKFFPEIANHVLVRRVLVTPTRLIFLLPNFAQMNRVLRRFGPENFILVSFCDEESDLIIGNDTKEFDNIRSRFLSILSNGLTAEGRRYEFLGCSNSQLRQHSCWMYSSGLIGGHSVEDIRRWMGNVEEIKCVATYMSRMDQFFSSSVQTADLSDEKYQVKEIADVERNGYCFTDGVGKISEDTASAVAEACNLKIIPSAFQIQLGGWEGVLAVDPKLPSGHVHIRPSMRKFDSEQKALRVLDYSRPQTLFLNRQVIMLLSQRGIPDEVFMRLQDAHLHNLMDMLTSNEKALQAMRTLDLDIDMKKLQNSGLDVTSDPFFRSILLVKYEDGLSDLLHKTRIPIPTEQGRLLMGVVDESNRLLPGQVFIQYTDEIKKGPVLVKGPVMVTKNPCFHPGDLRCFLAVDCEELRHMVDCVVFPVQGDRPQPNEMAGADLDGDLYWTTWHPDLIIKDNHQPMDFPKVPSEQLHHQPTQQELIKYFCNYVMNDRLGIIANAHLAFADSEEDGIFADKCLRLAELHSKAVDFPKTGHFPSVEMELRPTKYPDFMKKENEAHYESERILGKMYQVVSYLSDSMHSQMKSVWKNDPASLNINHQLQPLVDEYLLSNPYYEKAQKYYQQYASKMQFLLDTYGLEEESHTMVISLYRIKQEMLTEEDLREQARIMKCRVNRLKKEYLDVLLNHDLETELLTKALLWYEVAYQDGKFKSFAWVALNLIPSSVWRDRIDQSISHGIPGVEGTEEGQTNLRIQKKAFHQLEQAVWDRMPDLASTLHHVDLTIWNIEGNDIYVKLKNMANEDFAREEFAQLCSVMPQLGLNQNDISFENTGCYITKRGIDQRMTVDGCMVTAHLYLSGIYDEIMNQVVRLLPTSEVFRVCFQYICRFWNQSAEPRLRGIISVLHIADMILHFLQVDSHFLRAIDAIHGFLQWCVVWENLKLLQGASPQLWSLSDELMRLLQLILLKHLQLLSLSAMCDPLHAQPDDGKKKGRVIPISWKVSKDLIGMENHVCTTFSVRSGCTVSLKQVQNGKYYCYVAEGFGTERQLKRLLDEVRYFEFSFSVREAPWAEYSMVFEGLTDDRDELQIVQYKGPTYLSSHEDSLYMVGIRERDQPSQEKGFLLPQHLGEVQRFLKTLRCYSGLYYQDKVRITCRFGCFHFASKGDIPSAMTASEFKRRVFSSFRHSSFAYEVDRDGLKSFLVDKIGMVATKTEYRTVCEFNVDNRKVIICLDEHCTVTVMPHKNFRLRYLQLIRTLPDLTGLHKKVDIRFQFQAMLPIIQGDDEWYNKIQSKPILEREQHGSGDMPLLSVCPEFRQRVKYVRQKKIMTYTFPERTKQRHADHFTAHVKVAVIQVREYLNCDPETGKLGEIKEGNEVTVVIPTAPPLHYVSEYCELMEKLVGLCEKISDFIL